MEIRSLPLRLLGGLRPRGNVLIRAAHSIGFPPLRGLWRIDVCEVIDRKTNHGVTARPSRRILESTLSRLMNVGILFVGGRFDPLNGCTAATHPQCLACARNARHPTHATNRGSGCAPASLVGSGAARFATGKEIGAIVVQRHRECTESFLKSSLCILCVSAPLWLV